MEVNNFIRLNNYYRDMWNRQSLTLQPLTRLTPTNVKFIFTSVEHEVLKYIKPIIKMLCDIRIFTLEWLFFIHTDAKDYQLKVKIVQWFKHITFYSLNLIGNQYGYNITDKGLLSFVETFNWIYNKLLGNKIWVYTDHKNLTCKYFNTDIVMWWRLTIEEHMT